jgi:spermidine synthase
MSGAISLSYEVIWTRLLTASLGTYVYAYSTILATILLGTAIGALITPFILRKNSKYVLIFGLIQGGIGFLAVLSLIILGLNITLATSFKLILVLIPTSLLMGMNFPVIAALFENNLNLGIKIGFAYSLNTADSIIGPIITGFFLIGLIGTAHALLLLAIMNLTISGLLATSEGKNSFLLVFCTYYDFWRYYKYKKNAWLIHGVKY